MRGRVAKMREFGDGGFFGILVMDDSMRGEDGGGDRQSEVVRCSLLGCWLDMSRGFCRGRCGLLEKWDAKSLLVSNDIFVTSLPLAVLLNKDPSQFLPDESNHLKREIGSGGRSYYIAALPMTLRKMLCPSFNFAMRSSKNCLWRFALAGSEAMASTSGSVKPFTATGENIFSRPRMMWRSTTCVVTFATKVFCDTCMEESSV